MQQPKPTGTAIYAAVLLVCCGAPRSEAVQAAAAPSAQPLLTSSASADPKSAVLEETERLLQLARELKANVDKTRRDELSLQVIREADEVEKLARSVKARIH
jgi:hypothetical protein